VVGVHIPDGYLSPETCLVLTGAALPVWATAARRVRRTVTRRAVPLLALGAASSFLVMLLNIPVPDGTTAHAIGATLVAIVLGPWAAVIAVTAALVVQALFFGDGGVLALGANALNMAIIGPLVGYQVYRLLTRRLPATSPRRALAGGVAAYLGINAAALAAAVELGVQPDLFHAADGSPLYAPFHLAQTIPAMLLAHLTVAGFVEAALTAGVIAYLLRANPDVLLLNPHVARTATRAGRLEPSPIGAVPAPMVRDTAGRRRPSLWRWAAAGIAALVVLSPLGLLAPGGAFGEDAPADLDLHALGLRAVPAGLNRYNAWWSHAVLRDYGLGPGQNATLGYVVSAIVGVIALGALVLSAYVVTRLVGRARQTPGRQVPAGRAPGRQVPGGPVPSRPVPSGPTPDHPGRTLEPVEAAG
jgi:cobalt/nickel transport system permease protein